MHTIVSYAGVDFASLGFRAAAPFGVPAPERSPVALGRLNASALYGGTQRGLRPIPVEVRLDLGAAGVTMAQARTKFTDLLGRLNPDNPDPRTLVGKIDLDSDGTAETNVQIEAALVGWAWRGDADVILVLQFAAADPVWRKASPTGPGVFTVNASPTSLSLTNNGKARAYPIIRLCMASGGQRSSSTADVGWKYRKIQRITNATARDWNGLEPIFIDLGDTTGLVSGGKALSSGNDVRAVLHGKMLARTLMNWNSGRTFLVIHPEIPAGESVDVEIVYGNPNAGSPKTLSDRTKVDGDFCAVDLTADNGTSTGSNTTTTLNDTGKNWVASYWIGGFIQIVSGTGAGQRRRISDNTATQVTVERAWTTTPDATSKYCLWKSGIAVHGGIASAATSTTLTDSALALGTDEFRGGTITILSGTGSGQSRTITANTATQFTVSPAWTTTPNTTSVYYVERYGHYAYAVGTRDFDSGALDVQSRGGWQVNRFYSKPTEMAFGDFCVGGWQRDTFPTGGNDDFTQASYVDLGPVGVHQKFFQTGLEMRLRRNSPRTYSEEGLGNGVTFISPLGLTGLRFDYKMLNQNSASGATQGIGKLVVATRADGNLDWAIVLEDATRRTSFTTVATQFLNLRDADGNPTMVIMAGIPADEVEVAQSAAATDELRLRWNSRLEVQVDPTSITFGTLGAEESVYHLTATLRTGLTASPGHQRLIFGGEGHHFFLGNSTGDVIEVDCQAGTIRAYDGAPLSLSGGLLFMREVPWAARILHYPDDPDNDGVLDPRVSPAWMPLEVGSNTWYLEETAIGTLEVQILWYEGYYG